LIFDGIFKNITEKSDLIFLEYKLKIKSSENAVKSRLRVRE
jgi:hypothetical protein